MTTLTNAACVGRADLFGLVSISAHVEARAICATCPVLNQCQTEAATIPYKEGTWAGRLYVNGKRQSVVLPKCVICERDLEPTRGRFRKMHAGYCTKIYQARKAAEIASRYYTPRSRPDGSRGPLPSPSKCVDTPCPLCGAEPGKPCRTPRGEAVEPHMDRLVARSCCDCGTSLVGTVVRTIRCRPCAVEAKRVANRERARRKSKGQDVYAEREAS